MFIYENHMGGLFTSDEYLEDTYCETCGDSDSLIGEVNSKEDFLEMWKGYYFADCYSPDYVEEFIQENWGEE